MSHLEFILASTFFALALPKLIWFAYLAVGAVFVQIIRWTDFDD